MNDEFIRRAAVGVERFVSVSSFSVLQHRLDSTGISGTVKEASYDNLLVVDCEIDGVRETTEQATPEFIVNFRIKEGVSGNITGTGVKHPKKLFAKPRRFRFVPRIAAYSIIFDFRQKAKSVGHFRFSILVLRSSRDRRVPGAD